MDLRRKQQTSSDRSFNRRGGFSRQLDPFSTIVNILKTFRLGRHIPLGVLSPSFRGCFKGRDKKRDSLNQSISFSKRVKDLILIMKRRFRRNGVSRRWEGYLFRRYDNRSQTKCLSTFRLPCIGSKDIQNRNFAGIDSRSRRKSRRRSFRKSF